MPISMVPNVGMPAAGAPQMHQAFGRAAQAAPDSTTTLKTSALPSDAATRLTGGSNFQALDLVPNGNQGAGPLGEMAQSALGTVHSQIQTLAGDLPKHLQASKRDPVALEKEAMSAKSPELRAGNETKDSQQDAAVSALSATFDHAVFMAMVNQVISGVGDTTRTLIRQT